MRQVTFDKRPTAASTPERLTLFQPSIYTTSTPVAELDYNLHKSNSTYLTDLDIARGLHVFKLFRTGFAHYGAPGGKEGTVRFFPALGGVSCLFKREIKPFVKFEVWTRVLSWDSKWIYVVSHFVKAGAVRPESFVDQPWLKGPPRRRRTTGGGGEGPAKAGGEKGASSSSPAPPAGSHPAIYCTCVTKYVMKKGRKTIPPEEFLRVCDLLPDAAEGGEGDAAAVLEAITKRKDEGLAIAESFAVLDQAHDWFGADETAFATY